VALTLAMQGKPEILHGKTEDKPVLPVPGEVFALRKLLPTTADYDFNVHIMDFQPGESLNIKVRKQTSLEVVISSFLWITRGGGGVSASFSRIKVDHLGSGNVC
jgi:hypothetical protein